MTRVKSHTNKYLSNHINSTFRGRLKPQFLKSQIKLESSLLKRYESLKRKKGIFRSESIQNINTFCRVQGSKYSKFINILNTCNVLINRKSVSNIILSENRSIRSIVHTIII